MIEGKFYKVIKSINDLNEGALVQYDGNYFESYNEAFMYCFKTDINNPYLIAKIRVSIHEDFVWENYLVETEIN